MAAMSAFPVAYAGAPATDDWKEFPCEPFPDGFPEGNYKAVHCRVCGTKNRQDPGWRYKGSHKTTQAQEDATEQRLLRNPSRSFSLSGMARNTYECGSCRGDKNAPKPRDEERERRHAADITYMLAKYAERPPARTREVPRAAPEAQATLSTPASGSDTDTDDGTSSPKPRRRAKIQGRIGGAEDDHDTQ